MEHHLSEPVLTDDGEEVDYLDDRKITYIILEER